MITLVIVRAVTVLFHILKNHRLRLYLPAVITTVTTGNCTAMIQSLIGTSNIAATVLPGMVVAFCYNMLTTLKLNHQVPHGSSELTSAANDIEVPSTD